tara:strand:+ start:834 stop:1862 length:1029 start_codon:yes stop_codon:yes gene_type:complete
MADTVVDLGNGAPGMTMNEFMFGQRFPGEVFSGDALIPLSDQTDPLNDFLYQKMLTPGYEAEFLIDPSIETEDITDENKVKRFDPYEDNPSLAKPMYDTSNPEDALFLFKALARDRKGPEIALGEGGSVEEVGIMSALLDPRIDLPNAEEQGFVRESGREGSLGSEMYYAEGSPTFEQVLEDKYGYPEVARGDFYNTTEAMRAERPRHDMPTYQELEDARAHALMTARLAQQLGPETAVKLGGIQEVFDRRMPILGTATDADVVMDNRNNAFGAKLLKKAGVDASPQQIAAAVDKEVFDQLDRILGREPGERQFMSPEGGIDVYFPRDKYGYFDINRYQSRD